METARFDVRRQFFAILLLLATTASAETVGRVERLDPALDALIDPSASFEVLGDGLDWSEGPVWIRDGGFLLFSDVPQNRIYKWQEGEGLAVWLKPSGYTGEVPRGGEPGSNGLVLDGEGRLVMCQHGDRRVARLDAAWDDPRPSFVTLASAYDGKRFNSPNDLVSDHAGNFYFTDPPYGLEGGPQDPKREIDFQGVYRVTPEGEVTLVTGELTRPNGVGLSPDERTLYVANSDPERAVWMAYDLKDDGTVGEGRVFFDATPLVGEERPGLPDGFAVDRDGNLFATGPGGIFVFSPDGKHLGTLVTGQATANCTFGGDGKALYVTADAYLLRIPVKTAGLGFEEKTAETFDYPGGWLDASRCVDICGVTPESPVKRPPAVVCFNPEDKECAAKTGEGDYDYLILSQHWLPTVCAGLAAGYDTTVTHRDGVRCTEDTPSRLTIHGLWQNYTAGFPQCCGKRPVPLVPEEAEAWPAEVRKRMDAEWFDPTASGFVEGICDMANHEWQKHGTCFSEHPLDYFTATLDLADRLAESTRAIDAWAGTTQTKNAIEGVYPKAIQLLCDAQRPERLLEIHTCWDREMNLIDCPPTSGFGPLAVCGGGVALPGSGKG